MEWTEEVVAQLRKWWAEGLSTAEIGRKLNMTKNAVVGKAHRLKLPPRPSPIKRGKKKTTEATAKAAPKATKAKKPAVAKEEKAAKAPAKKKSAAKTKATSKKKEKEVSAASDPNYSIDSAISSLLSQARDVKEEQEALASVAPKPKASSSKIVGTCQWPIGDPSQPDFHYCEAEVYEGKPYCLEHCAVAYVRLRERR